MDNIKIQTTQNVDIEYELASIGDRILATLLDGVFFFAYFLLLMLFLSLMNGLRSGNMTIEIILIVASLPLMFYNLLCEI
ncbi:MAG: RDD family protein, partial [Bacteroidia bacterium]